ncbi:MAG: bifunctional phosphopantothenoylcysteine decarboxylase/phosphopantothenate--cysteine ligase CoaBC [Acidobacteria bacterium]|nr:bifunctional phosphopantothenoylcysteine decarboxylase/phosphopantothenate--cysteine ligase CoaBC [Acidobacteriota bacterium]MBI3427527.1 bifunctional phosphopantothenoylcysteine decarboxylase/phosphopantothenate--cysteine ligase CoaBC [Acidobacteriota bacterium]
MAAKVLLGVTGCIGAYKAAEVLRGLQKAGVEVRVMMTRHATEFIAPLTFEALSGYPVIVEMFDRPSHAEIEHISLARWAELILIAPATANCLAKFAHGLADDFLSTVYLSNTNPVMIAPAMNVEMWQHAATQANLATLKTRGVHLIEPGSGYQACGEIGAGRLAEPAEIVARALANLKSQISNLKLQDLTGEHILLTAGPTVEDLDPVRFITNRSSGKMGYALAVAAQARGARVTLVSGPTRLPPPAHVETINVRSTREMYDAVLSRLSDATVFIGCAAVADFRPAQKADNKIKKLGRTNITLELETTEDIIAAVGAAPNPNHRLVIGFAAESQELLAYAERKLREKGLDAIVANDITRQDAGFDTDTNAATILRRDGSRTELPLQDKRALAERVLDELPRLRKV